MKQNPHKLEKLSDFANQYPDFANDSREIPIKFQSVPSKSFWI